LLATTLAAMVGAFMVSYASAIERELGQVPSSPMTMRRLQRLIYLLAGASLGPFVGLVFPSATNVPVLAAVVAIAVFGNHSAIRRLSLAAQPARFKSDLPSNFSAGAPPVSLARARR
jgi:hypothetical protein